MSVILAIDTSTQSCSAALLQGTEVIQEMSVEPRSHTRLLLPMVDKLLSTSGLTLSQLDAIAYTAGPGSFTGLRIGFGVVQGLAFGSDLPVIGVSTLYTLITGAQRQLGLDSGQLVMPAFDARMGEIYWGLYRTRQDDLALEVIPDRLTPPEVVGVDAVAKESIVGIGEGWRLGQQFPIKAQATYPGLLPEAQDVLPLAQHQWLHGGAVAVEQAELVYLRDTVSWKKRKRLRK